MLKKFVYLVGIGSLCILLIGAAGFIYLNYWGQALDKESKAFADEATKAIAAHWSGPELLHRATPELRKSLSEEKLASFLTSVSALGSMTDYQGSIGEANITYNVGSPTVITATYMAKAKFEHGSAEITIALTRRDVHWFITGFHVRQSLALPIGPAEKGT